MTDPQRLDDIKAREEKIARDSEGQHGASSVDVNFVINWYKSQLSLAQSALRTARADAMEEAAKVNEVRACGTGMNSAYELQKAADDIRQLAQTGGEG